MFDMISKLTMTLYYKHCFLSSRINYFDRYYKLLRESLKSMKFLYVLITPLPKTIYVYILILTNLPSRTSKRKPSYFMVFFDTMNNAVDNRPIS